MLTRIHIYNHKRTHTCTPKHTTQIRSHTLHTHAYNHTHKHTHTHTHTHTNISFDSICENNIFRSESIRHQNTNSIDISCPALHIKIEQDQKRRNVSHTHTHTTGTHDTHTHHTQTQKLLGLNSCSLGTKM